MPGYLAQLQGIFPSLHLKQVVLGYLGENRYALALQGDLEVVIVQPGAALGWEPPKWNGREQLDWPLVLLV